MSIIKAPLRLPQKSAVYNLTIADAHCYFANGVLVHNCDAMAWLGIGLSNMVIPPSAEEDSWMTYRAEKRKVEQERMSFMAGGDGRAITGY